MAELHREGAVIELIDDGKIFVESKDPSEREEPERIKIYDSDHKYLGYVYDDGDDCYDNLLNKLGECANALTVLDYLGILWDAIFIRRFRSFIDRSKVSEEYINRIGSYYVVVSE